MIRTAVSELGDAIGVVADVVGFGGDFLADTTTVSRGATFGVEVAVLVVA
jgi:hypothetical protein